MLTVSASAAVRRIVRVFRSALALYRAHWWTLFVVGLLVFTPAAILEALVDYLSDRHLEALPFDAIVIGVVAAGVNTLAYQMYKGIATNASVLWRAGQPQVPVRRVLRNLPYLQLLLADLIITFGTALGLGLLIVPGVFFATWASLTPVLIELEGRNVWSGLKRSWQLVKGSFFTVLALQVIVLVVQYGLEAAFHGIGESLLPHSSPLDDAVALGAATAFVASILVKPISALALIELTHELIAGTTRKPTA